MFFARHLFISFFLFALAEAILLAKVGTAIGWGITIALIVLTAMIGSFMFRKQGVLTLTKLNQRMAQGELPGQEMVEGVLILIGGALLMTPGFLTDVIGFIFLIGSTRRAVAAWMISKGIMQAVMTPPGANSQVWVYRQTSWQNSPFPEKDVTPMADEPLPRGSRGQGGQLIEGEYQIEDKDKPKS